VPDAHMDAIFTDLMTSAAWSDPSYDFVPAVVFQVWVEKNNGKAGAFHTFLNTSDFTTQNSLAVFDLTHLKPLLAQLIPLPSTPATPPRGTFLLALLYLVSEKSKAPAEAKAYIKAVVGLGGTTFPDTAGVDDILMGSTHQSVLENAGVIAKISGPKVVSSGSSAPSGPVANLDTNHSGNNTLAVDSVTSKCRTHGTFNTNVYMLPSGNKIGSVPAGRTFNVVGKAKGLEKGLFTDTPNADYLAIEHSVAGHQTVFVLAKDVQQ